MPMNLRSSCRNRVEAARHVCETLRSFESIGPAFRRRSALSRSAPRSPGAKDLAFTSSGALRTPSKVRSRFDPGVSAGRLPSKSTDLFLGSHGPPEWRLPASRHDPLQPGSLLACFTHAVNCRSLIVSPSCTWK